MTQLIEILKDPDGEYPVPTAWRRTLSTIVDALARGDFVMNNIKDVIPLTSDTANSIRRNISAYQSRLSRLPESTWQTSVCRWMEGYWDVLVDLFTDENEQSDLVLFVKVDEFSGSYRFNIDSVHVP